MNIGHFLDVRDLILAQCLKERCVSADKGRRDDQIPKSTYSPSGKPSRF